MQTFIKSSGPQMLACIINKGSLDLNGFVLSCGGADSENNDGVVLTGKAPKLFNGTVGGYCDDGVVADSDGSKCQITNVLSIGHAEDGFYIGADGCKLTGNVAMDNGDAAVQVGSNKVTLTGNLALNNEYGFYTGSGSEKIKFVSNVAAGTNAENFRISGTGHTVQKNLAVGSNEEGFEFRGTKHKVIQNQAFYNDYHGIANYATNTKIQKNVSSANGGATRKDMYENTAGCGSNSWKSNVFGTSEDNGTSPSTCIQ